ncbi:MAG: hypothetical protein U0790_16770 [Isosphaeraceae bacterium]
MNHRLLGFLVVAAVLPGQVPAGTGQERARPPADLKQLEAWWSDLEGDEAVAARALLQMADRPAQAVEFLKERMKPLRLDSVRLKAYLLRLASGNEELWKKAFEDLEYYDPRLAMDLPSLMEKVKETPTRQRLVEVLSGRDAGSLKYKTVELRKFDRFYNFFADNGSWWAEPAISQINSASWGCLKKKWTRAVRAIVLLEHIHTPEAIAILRDMTTGNPDAQPTRVANEAVKRLERPGTGGAKAADTGRRP